MAGHNRARVHERRFTSNMELSVTLVSNETGNGMKRVPACLSPTGVEDALAR